MPITESPVLVTGASGFIASHLVSQLLERGYRVRGSVRSLAKQKDIAHLRALPGAERLELFEADLLKDAAFDEAARGCSYVMHTASPYALEAKDPQKDLVEPAVKGTRNVLASCKKAGTVKRVVLTSSPKRIGIRNRLWSAMRIISPKLLRKKKAGSS
jgi:dihydroflavonol-4-reductase